MRAARMRRRERELVEVVLDRLDLAVVADLVAEAEEGVLDDAADVRRRVERPNGQLVSRQRDVEAVGAQPLVELGAPQLRFALGERSLEPLAHRVQGHPRLAVAYLA